MSYIIIFPFKIMVNKLPLSISCPEYEIFQELIIDIKNEIHILRFSNFYSGGIKREGDVLLSYHRTVCVCVCVRY